MNNASGERGGMAAVLTVCAALGMGTVAFTISRSPAGSAERFTATAALTEEYGRGLIANTTEYLGPDVADAKMRYTDSRLACASCHLGAGVEPGNLSLATAYSKYPRTSPRSGGN